MNTTQNGKTNQETRKPGKNGTSRRVKMLVRRALKLHDRICELSEKKRQAIELAMQNGLAMNQIIELDGEKWMIIEPVGRFIYFGKHELKKLPKNPRSKAKIEEGVNHLHSEATANAA